MSKYKVIDLFSGCGGSALGFKRLGFDVSVAVDINKIASASFKQNFPECTVLNEDILLLTGSDLLQASGEKSGKNIVLIACPPCQGFSTARRYSQRLADPRNKLVLELIRIIDEIRPHAFVFENVPGLARGRGKELLDEVLIKLSEFGYGINYRIIDTADYGVPQHRKRVVVIGVLGKKDPLFPIRTHGSPDKLEAGLVPWKTVRETIAKLPKICAGETHKKDKLHRSASLAKQNLERIRADEQDGGDRSTWPSNLIPDCHKNINGYKDVYGRMWWDRPSPAITGGCAMLSKGRFGHPEQDRAVSLREAARLQTFPDDFIFTGNFGDIAKQIGNAVPPKLGEVTAKAILDSSSL